MREIYRKPLRVYILLGFLSLVGVVAGLQLPISLFPNSSQPHIYVEVNYGDMSVDEFQAVIGQRLESEIASALIDGYRVEHLYTEYKDNRVVYQVQFEWGTNGQKALRELQSIVNSLSGSWPEEIRRTYSVEFQSNNGGFFALSFYSSKRSLDEVYELLRPLLRPGLTSVTDAQDAELWNPQEKSVEVTLNAEKLASLQILPSDVEAAIVMTNHGYAGGSLEVGDGNHLNIFLPRALKSVDDIGNVTIKTRSGRTAQIKDVASIKMTVDKKTLQSFKTNGVASLILFAQPRAGGNIKKMSDQIMEVLEKAKPGIPPDIEYRVLVNPSEFINSSINGVIREVGLAAFLAVLILFLFIGSFKNVITAAIEIPMSMVLAFIFMKIFNMNLNLISLGGLALSAGMNVDASVVVMENIFRHFEPIRKKLNFEERLSIVVQAVNEVKSPIIASTVASLVVFIPLIATHGLTNAILGDLAKAVVFSHSLSAVVALILVPTIRMQLMNTESNRHPKSPIEGILTRFENFYAKTLGAFLVRRNWRFATYLGVGLGLVVLSLFVIPRLPKEIVGKPDTDWIILGIRPQNFTEPAQLNNLVEKIEFDVLKKYESDMLYTFTQLHGVNNGMIMVRLKSKQLMDKIWKSLEAEYVNTPDTVFFVAPWNPSELQIPDPPHFKLEVRGGTAVERAGITHELSLLLQEESLYPSTTEEPAFAGKEKSLMVRPIRKTLFEMAKSNILVTDSDISNYLRIATAGKVITQIGDQSKSYNLQLKFPNRELSTVPGLKALPLGLDGKILPMSALAEITQIEKPAPTYRVDQAEVNVLEAKLPEAQKSLVKISRERAIEKIRNWKEARQDYLAKTQISVTTTNPDIELDSAIDQLKWAIVLSIGLIFLTMVLQFGDFVHALLVLVAIPLGIIGVLLSLWIFSSNLSLNSVLGVILLNGIAVANSVILVDFMKRLVDEGKAPIDAAVYAAKTRLRPIFMTSLTTILGMMPIAFGMGEGGKILQPLGIAVSGGLWISMLLTLYIVPALQVSYLQWKVDRQNKMAENSP